MPNYIAYQKSISDQLIAAKNRVRNFIDEAHWEEDGRYKEIVLKELLAEKLPSNVSLGTGFVMGERLSTQIDIIVYRSDIPLLFQKLDFVIVPESAVLGIIEVKTKLDSANIEEAFKKAHENGSLIHHYIFNGIFSYDLGFQLENRLAQKIKDVCHQYCGQINNISFGQDYFVKYWPEGMPCEEPNNRYRFYKINNLSFGYFISNLVEDVYTQIHGNAIPEPVKRMLYPIENTKEAHTKYTIIL